VLVFSGNWHRIFVGQLYGTTSSELHFLPSAIDLSRHFCRRLSSPLLMFLLHRILTSVIQPESLPLCPTAYYYLSASFPEQPVSERNNHSGF